jgi:hypothetical protein
VSRVIAHYVDHHVDLPRRGVAPLPARGWITVHGVIGSAIPGEDRVLALDARAVAGEPQPDPRLPGRSILTLALADGGTFRCNLDATAEAVAHAVRKALA